VIKGDFRASALSISAAAASAAGVDRYTDATWKTIEDRIAEFAKRVG
jgi:hypothetical protein